MFTLTLENAKKADLVYLYIKENFDTSSYSIKKHSENLEFKFRNLTDLYREFSLSFTDLIIFFYEQKLVKNILKKNYFYFSDDEQEEILNICNSMLNDEESHHKKDLIFLSVHDYIQNNSFMNLEGFVNFRLQGYMKNLDYIVDLSVNKFITDKEYLEFVNMLKLYVTLTPPKASLVHLIYFGGDSILLSKDKKIIPLDDDTLSAKYLSDITFSSNDYALNTLLSLLPGKLEIHLIDGEDEFIETLKLIFEDRVYVCSECNICKTYKLLHGVSVLN